MATHLPHSQSFGNFGWNFPGKWWNWQTHHLEGVAPTRRAGSSPAFPTNHMRDGFPPSLFCYDGSAKKTLSLPSSHQTAAVLRRDKHLQCSRFAPNGHVSCKKRDCERPDSLFSLRRTLCSSFSLFGISDHARRPGVSQDISTEQFEGSQKFK